MSSVGDDSRSLTDFGVTCEEGLPMMSLSVSDSMKSNVVLSRTIRRGAFFLDPNMGSRLYTVKKIADQNLSLCGNYERESLIWLVESGRASEVFVSVNRAETDRVDISDSIVKRNGYTDAFTFFKKVI